MKKKIAVLLLSMSMLCFVAGCSDREETDTENAVQEAEEEFCC